jgi:flagellar M-ring protein FliF
MDKFKESFSKGYTNIKEKWTGIAGRTRTIILAVTGVILVSAILITVVLNRPQPAVLCVVSSETEAHQIAGVLANSNIIATVTRNNEVIIPDARQLGPARVVLTQNNLPTRGQNNDVWNNAIGMFTTESVANEAKKHQYQQWIMDYLVHIDDVESARVILNIPQTKNYVLVQGRDPSSASVAVTLRPGRALSQAQINGITNFVTTSVPGLTNDNVTVTDGNGVPLIATDGISDFEDIAARQQRLSLEFGYKTLMSDTAQAQLVPMFSRVFGEHGFEFAVNVVLDNRDDVLVEEEIFTPVVGLDEGIIRNVLRQHAAGYTANEGLPVGTFGNSDIAPDYPTLTDIQAGGDVYLEWQEKIEYEINRRHETFRDNGLRVEKISASLIFNSEAITEYERDEWRRLIADGIGADVDNVSVMTKVFPPPPTPGIDGRTGPGEAFRDVLIWVIIVLGLFLIVILVLMLLTSGRKKRHIRYRGAIPAADGMGGYLRDDSFQPLPSEPEGFDLPSLLDENETKDVVLKREIKEFSKSNPEIIAQLIRTWFREDEP